VLFARAAILIHARIQQGEDNEGSWRLHLLYQHLRHFVGLRSRKRYDLHLRIQQIINYPPLQEKHDLQIGFPIWHHMICTVT
jgi:hypothetical protein